MKAIFHKSFSKFLKTVNEDSLKKIIKEKIDNIISGKDSGDLLNHPFKRYNILRVKFNYKKNSYRIAYIKADTELVFLLIDSRENFYKKLQNLI